ncbi:NAD(P)-dependent oxidoreductase [Bacillus salipaludis]|uniref:NAD-dependent epimerase/dehydratase family protein n=1 Tax=Bacillus salipaludis TaxID=2547811 RepID=UPI003D19874D
MKKVLITGASGFIGRYAVRLLKEYGYEIHAVSKTPHENDHDKCFWHQQDLFDFDGIYDLTKQIGPTHLLHLAWDVPPSIYINSLNNYKWVTASMNLIQAFQRFGGERIVVAGSCIEYDWTQGLLRENETPLSYENPYSTSKNALQHLVKSYARTVGMSVAWGRIFWLYGPYENQKRLIPSAIKNLLEDKEFVCRDGNSIRDFLFVSDVADALVHLLLSNVEGPVNIASGNETRIKDILTVVGNQLNKRQLIKYSKSFDNNPFVVGDTSRLKMELNWYPKIDVETGIYYTIQYWKKAFGGSYE